MSKKHTMKKTAAILLGVALTAGATGCNFITTDSDKDLAQVVASVNISDSLKTDDKYSAKATEVSRVIKECGLDTDIYKRDLVAYFLSTGYNYVENYGYTYEDTFNMLLDGLVSRKIMLQYAVAYYLSQGEGVSVDACKSYINAQLAAADKEEAALLKEYPEVLTIKYFLTDGGVAEATEDYDRTVYTLKKSFNDSLDSMEESIIAAEEENHDHGEIRTLPTNAGTEKSDYYTTEYDVYTGRNVLGACGEYEKVDGSTTTTRKKAYNTFLANLQSYNLIKTSGDKVEDTADVTKLEYYYVELSSMLGQALITKYFEDLEEDAIESLTDEYVKTKYDSIYAQQSLAYGNDPKAFETAIGGLSDDSFVLYGQQGFGFVYNILLPFSSSQNVRYTEEKNRGLTEDELFNARKAILSEVKGKDLRDSWISSHDHANYATLKEDGKYYFFEDNLTNSDKYEAIKQYTGKYPYNGEVTEDETTGEYECTPTPVDINGFITIMEDYIRTVVNDEAVTVSGAPDNAYDATTYVDPVTDEVDYSKFVYYRGKVNGLNATAAEYFNAESNSCKAVSAVNELMFAYSTDMGCLNTYMGYAVSPYGTNFVPEFEYAAQEAIKGGVGSYVVCATDYGWHIVYATFVYSAEDVYGGYVAAEKEIEGTFSNLFYESLKTSLSNNHANETQSSVLNKYDNDTCVSRYQSRYQDLLDLDS